MRQAIILLEKMIEANALEMKILAYEYIKNNSVMSNSELKTKFHQLEQRNIALEKAVDELLFTEV